MHGLVRQALVIGALLAAPSVALASPVGVPPACPIDLLLEGRTAEIGAGAVVGTGPARFQNDVAGCPGDAPRCTRKAYVVKGDTVVTGLRRGGFVCVLFPNDRGADTEGWVRADRISPLPAPAASASRAWAGSWSRGDDGSIEATARGEVVSVDGYAEWRGPIPGNVHNGGLTGEGRPEGSVLTVGDEFCKATLRLVGPYLAVSDNDRCGGANVTFTGVYRRQ